MTSLVSNGQLSHLGLPQMAVSHLKWLGPGSCQPFESNVTYCLVPIFISFHEGQKHNNRFSSFGSSTAQMLSPCQISNPAQHRINLSNLYLPILQQFKPWTNNERTEICSCFLLLICTQCASCDKQVTLK